MTTSCELSSPFHQYWVFASRFRKVCALNRQINRENNTRAHNNILRLWSSLRPANFMAHIWTHITIVFISGRLRFCSRFCSVLFSWVCSVFFLVSDLFLILYRPSPNIDARMQEWNEKLCRNMERTQENDNRREKWMLDLLWWEQPITIYGCKHVQANVRIVNPM